MHAGTLTSILNLYTRCRQVFNITLQLLAPMERVLCTNLRFVVPCTLNHSNKNTQLDATINSKIYCFVVQTPLNVFQALQCPSSGACQTAAGASGFRMNVEVEVFSAVFSLRTLPPPHSYGNRRLQRQFDGLMMMGIVMPKTC